MNISPVNLNVQNFASKKIGAKKQFSRHDSGYIFPNKATKAPRGPRGINNGNSVNKGEEPEIVKTIIHWMNYGDGVLVPVTVEVAE